MLDNPFNSAIFTDIWLRHYKPEQAAHNFPFLPLVKCTKSFIPFLFINVGSTLTKGISYNLVEDATKSYKKKVFLIYDIPTYLNSSEFHQFEGLTLKRIPQYPGFLIQLDGLDSLDEYLRASFSKSGRYKLKKYRKRLEKCFDIRYRMYSGPISKDEYNLLFNQFKALLEKRFAYKQTTNNNLDPKEWAFYEEVAYPMILEEKAGLFVVYDGEKPISITLNYFSETTVFDAITVFDMDYAKFHLGSVALMELINWCLSQKKTILDFSKGYFDYKKRWGNKQYQFEYHILYDKNFFPARITAWGMASFYSLKQSLRDAGLNDLLHQITYRLRHKGSKQKSKQYSFDYETKAIDRNHLVEMPKPSLESSSLKGIIFDFLYLHSENINDLKVYKISNVRNKAFRFEGKGKSADVILN